MTLDEAIKHCEDVADYDCFTDDQRKCSEEHRQLADWLRDYKRLLEESEIIRCKNCKWWGRKDVYKDDSTMIVCKKGRSIDSNGFCHYAERGNAE